MGGYVAFNSGLGGSADGGRLTGAGVRSMAAGRFGGPLANDHIYRADPLPDGPRVSNSVRPRLAVSDRSVVQQAATRFRGVDVSAPDGRDLLAPDAGRVRHDPVRRCY